MDPTLRARIIASNDVRELDILLPQYVSLCVEHAETDAIASLICVLGYAGPVLKAVAKLRGRADLWPLFEQLARDDDGVAVELVMAAHHWLRSQRKPAVVDEKLARLAEISVVFAARTADALASEPKQDSEPLLATLVALANHADPEARGHARRGLTKLAQRGVSFDTSALEASLRSATRGEATHLANLLTHLHLAAADGSTTRLHAWLGDARPAVRLGVLQALAISGKWRGIWRSPFIGAIADVDAAVRAFVVNIVLVRAEQHADSWPDDETVAQLLRAAEGPAAADIERYLLVVVSRDAARLARIVAAAPPSPVRTMLQRGAAHLLSEPLTRACNSCRSLGASATWNNDYSQPVALKQLETVEGKGLRRCSTCSAYFRYSYDVEYDVNSAHEEHVLARLTQREALAEGVDTSHPRWGDWRAALRSDLDHPDAVVCRQAAWELARDACATSDFATLDAQLLHHDRAEVIDEGLRALWPLSASPVARETLQDLSVHGSPSVRKHASYLLTRQDALLRPERLAWWAQDDASAEGQAIAFDRLLDDGQSFPPASVSAPLDHALQRTTALSYPLTALIQRVAFGGDDGAFHASRVLTALGADDEQRRHNALALAERLPQPILCAPQTLQTALAAERIDPANGLALVCAVLMAGAPFDAAAPLLAAKLRGRRADAQRVAVALASAYERNQRCDAVFVPLCEYCARDRLAYVAMNLVQKWATQHSVPSEGLPWLQKIVDEGNGSFRDSAVAAVAALRSAR